MVIALVGSINFILNYIKSWISECLHNVSKKLLASFLDHWKKGPRWNPFDLKKKKRTTKKWSNLLWSVWLKWLKFKHKLENFYMNLLCLPFFLSNNEESCHRLFVHQTRLFLVVHKEINTNYKKLRSCWSVSKYLLKMPFS